MGRVAVVSASAGSGKTRRLAYEYVREVVHYPESYSHVLAVTFTNLATEEMKDRILKYLNELSTKPADSQLWDDLCGEEFVIHDAENKNVDEFISTRAKSALGFILHDYDNFAVMTIDKFFQRIVRSFTYELGVDVNYAVELETDVMLSEAVDRLIDRFDDDPATRRWIEAYVGEQIENGRSWNIRNALMGLGTELFNEEHKALFVDGADVMSRLQSIMGKIVAADKSAREKICAASRAILSIVESALLSPESFSNGLKGAMGVVVRLASGELTDYISSTRFAQALEDPSRLAAKKSTDYDAIMAIAPQIQEQMVALAAECDAGRKAIANASLVRSHYRSFALLSMIYDNVTEVCKEENLLHITEINGLIAKLIDGSDAPFIYEKCGNRFGRYMIDEFQDTSRVQWRNFVPLLQNAVAQSVDDAVLLVGDVKQAIYRWRGGDWDILARDVERTFDECDKSSLSINYRSRRNIVEFNNRLIGRCVEIESGYLGNIVAEAAELGQIDSALASNLSTAVGDAYGDYVQQARSSATQGYVTVTEIDYGSENVTKPQIDQDIAARTIALIEEIQTRAIAPSDIAVLVRGNSEGALIASSLLEYKTSHPDSHFCYDVITPDLLSVGRADINRFVIAVLRLSVNAKDAISLAVCNSYLGNRFDAPLPNSSGELLDQLSQLSPEEAFELIVNFFGLDRRENELAYLQALHQSVIQFSTKQVADIPLFLEWWDQKGSSKSIAMPRTARAINVMTIHRAKGLKFRAVILPFCSWSLNPRGTVWAEATDGLMDTIGRYPVNYGTTMAESSFAGDYYRELVMSHIDSMNIFYVAVTRPVDELHLFVPMTASSDRFATVGDMLHKAFRPYDSTTIDLGLSGSSVEEQPPVTRYVFGSPTASSTASSSQDATARQMAVGYRTFLPHNKVAFTTAAQRYIDQQVNSELSPRNYGVLMHALFAQASTRDDILDGMRRMQLDGVISASESDRLHERVEAAFSDSLVADWFSGRWQQIRNENSIVVPGAGAKRPDRVMIADGRAVVVDYKFGERIDDSYLRQVAEYMNLLRQMGYASVDGYLWYISHNRIVQV